MMKNFRIPFLICALIIGGSITTQGQSDWFKTLQQFTDSILKATAEIHSNENHSTAFNKMVSNRKLPQMMVRLDRESYDFVYLKETYQARKESYTIKEYYGLKNDSIFLEHFVDLEEKAVNESNTSLFIPVLIDELTKGESIQTTLHADLIVNLKIKTPEGYEKMPRKEVREAYTDDFTNTYEVETLIDKQNHKIYYRLSIPPAKAKFKIRTQKL